MGGGNGGSGFLWFMGTLGAAIYYVQAATTFGEGIIGLLKALIWPLFLVYHLLQMVGA